jgi:hypothetical protein
MQRASASAASYCTSANSLSAGKDDASSQREMMLRQQISRGFSMLNTAASAAARALGTGGVEA